MKQTDALLALLRERGPLGVTPLEALEAIGSFRLAARIFDLRAEGYDIERQTWTTPSGATVARYCLIEAPVQQQLAL